MAEREAIWLFTHRLSHSLHLHGGDLHQIKILARHCDGPAAAVTQTHTHTDKKSHLSSDGGGGSNMSCAH